MDEKKKQILRMVEEGIIKTDEALRLLKALEEAENLENHEKTSQELSTHVKFDDTNDSKKETSDDQSFTGKISQFIQQALTKLPYVDVQLASSIKFEHIYQFNQTDLRHIHVDIFNGGIILTPWDQSDIRVECAAKMYKQKEIEASREMFFNEVIVKVDDGVLKIDSSSKQIKLNVNVHVPKQMYETIRLRLFGGTVSASDLHAHRMIAKTANGKITLASSYASELDVETGNGAIEAINVQGNDGKFSTLNGHIHVKGAFSDLEANTITSKVTCEWTEFKTGKVALKSITGVVECTIPQGLGAQGQLTTNLGNIHTELDKYRIIEDKKERIQKTFAFAVNEEADKKVNIEMSSNAGSLTMKQTS